MAVIMRNITFSYDKNTPILTDFNATIDQGQIAAVIGNSGVGKSTLLGILTGILTPQKGEILIEGVPILTDKINLKPEKRQIGMLFQDHALFPHMTVEKNIGFGLKGPKADQLKTIQKMLELIGLQGYEKRYPHELSGGQQQRVALARALAPAPRLLLLDEPFSHLDTTLKHQIRLELKAIIKSTETTALFVTHDMDDAHEMADIILRLDA